MKKSAVLILVAMVVSVGISRASIVTLSGSRAGPIAVTTGGDTVSGGLIRVGTFSDMPTMQTVEAIDAVFEEFATGLTGPTGLVGQTFNNANASEFNGDQIYLWVFDTPDVNSATEYGIFTISDPDAPDPGSPWRFPVHTGSGTDTNTISLSALLSPGGLDSTFQGRVNSAGGGQLILGIPEPTSGLLGLTGLLLILRRRR